MFFVDMCDKAHKKKKKRERFTAVSQPSGAHRYQMSVCLYRCLIWFCEFLSRAHRASQTILANCCANGECVILSTIDCIQLLVYSLYSIILYIDLGTQLTTLSNRSTFIIALGSVSHATDTTPKRFLGQPRFQFTHQKESYNARLKISGHTYKCRLKYH